METNEVPNIQKALERFNPAQREAASTTLGPMLIVAGAGSGKTSVLTTRIALLMSQGVEPERILALTFTKKAAEEMRNRIIDLQGEGARRITMGTFHSVFIRFLRPYAPRLGFSENFTILDEDDATGCLKKCIDAVIAPNRPPKETWSKTMEEKFKEEDKHYKPKTIGSIISKAKNELMTADAYAASEEMKQFNESAQRPLTGKIFQEYRNTCFRMNMMDFDDILLYTDMLLALNPDVQAMIAGAYDYILVDEYQDTNMAQYSILKRLTWINKNICVVGDDSQSIYAFRGARIENIMNFQKDFPGCAVVKLEQNYRSTKNIVNAANNLISKNEGRIPKTCFSDSDRGEPLCIKTCDTEKGEALYIASIIRSRHRQDNSPYSNFAILYRTNAQSRAIEDALVKNRIPYTVYSGTSFFSRMEIKDLMAYWRLAVNPNDDESFLRVVNKPARRVGDAAQKLLCETARAWNCSIWQVVTNPQLQLLGLSSAALHGIEEFANVIQTGMQLAEDQPAHKAASAICDMTGFYQEYSSETDEDSKKRADNIRELVDSVKSYEEDVEAAKEGTEAVPSEQPTLSGYLQNVMLLSNADTGEEGDKVSLMTVHSAKGLEFDTVFIAGMEKNLFPLEIDGDKFEEEEERRLFYVAVTRAKKELIMTKAESRLRFGKRTFTKPSPFLSELRSGQLKRN